MRLQNVIALNMALQPCCGGNAEVLHGMVYDSFDKGCSTDNVVTTKKVSPDIFHVRYLVIFMLRTSPYFVQ